MAIRVKRQKCHDLRIQEQIDVSLYKFKNQEAKWLLVEALLSGNYKQCKGHLRQNDGFCCLGVACDVARKHGNLRNTRWHVCGLKSGIYTFSGSTTFLPPKVAEWLGTDCIDPCVIYGGQVKRLSALNDDGVPFNMIAGLIINQL
jgi:hypothetical protein